MCVKYTNCAIYIYIIKAAYAPVDSSATAPTTRTWRFRASIKGVLGIADFNEVISICYNAWVEARPSNLEAVLGSFGGSRVNEKVSSM